MAGIYVSSSGKTAKRVASKMKRRGMSPKAAKAFGREAARRGSRRRRR